MAPAQTIKPGTEHATFALGCFWSVQLAYSKVPGVVNTFAGFAIGKSVTSFKNFMGKSLGHTEAVLVEYDPMVVTYDELLDLFWSRFTPTGADRASSELRYGVYFHTEEQGKLAQARLEQERVRWQTKLSSVELLPLASFSPATEHHQHYLRKRNYK